MLHYKAQIYGMFVIAVLFFMCWFGIKNKSKENKIFNATLLVGFVNLIFDIASNYTVNHLYTVNPMVNRVVHICFFVTMAALFLFIYLYLATIVEKELDRPLRGRRLTYVPFIIVVLVDIFAPIYYKEVPSGNYSYGPGVVILYVSVIFYVGLIIWHISRFRKNISKRNRVAVVLGLVSVMVASLFQMIFPAALTSSLGVLLFCLFMYMTVANPDVVLVGLLKEETARADAANRAKSDFLAKMSHEIRTPINAVIGMNEMILRESTEQDIRKYSNDIKSSANTLLSIINEILDSSKIESGKMEIIANEYEISSMLYDLYNMINLKAKAKGLKLIFDIDSNLPAVYYGDDVRIRQVLVNLLTNAVKYTNEGIITMTVTGEYSDGNAVLHFSVKDTGIGIKEEDMGKLFEQFERIEETRNHYIEGTGLGMNISMQLLRLMGSELKVRSEYNVGSEFYFDIVQDVVKNEPIGDFKERISRKTDEDEYTVSYTASEASVLVVDDNDINRKVVRGLLKQTGIKVYEAESGRKCIDMVAERRFDIIFLDGMMPVMDGVQTLHELKNRGLCDDTPVIMLTANAVVGAKEEYLREGFDDYLTKPINPKKLDKMILKYLSKDLIINDGYDKMTDDAKADEMPQLDEFDFDYAMNILGSREVLESTLSDFSRMLNLLPDKLSGLYDSIDESESLNNYRIEVHALKSTSAMVGAMLLSKLARLLEAAAAEGNIERIRKLHGILLEEMMVHRERIQSIIVQEDSSKDMADKDTIMSYLDMLQYNLEGGDYDSADFIMDEMHKFRYPDEIHNLVDELSSNVANLDADAATDIISQIKKVW